MGNACPVADSLGTAVSPIPSGETVGLTCSGHDPDGVVTKFVLTTTVGTFANGLQTIEWQANPSGPSASATLPWSITSTLS